MNIRFKGRDINLKRVITITRVETNKFRVYAGDTYSFSVIFQNEYECGVPVREPMHFCSYDKNLMELDRQKIYEQFCQARIQ